MACNTVEEGEAKKLMVNMLVVDDDRFEREGVRFLVEEYGLPIKLAEADSAEAALDYLQSESIDILLTDIRMQEMDGLQLAEHVRLSGRPVKVIFMSAYGEFEYARKAIDLNAVTYLLKPVQIDEFLKVISQTVQLLKEERQDMQSQEHMRRLYLKGVRYEKQRLVAEMLNGPAAEAEETRDQDVIIKHLDGGRSMRMAMICTTDRFFDRIDTDFERRLGETLDCWNDVVPLNEFQSLVFIDTAGADGKEELLHTGNRLVHWMKEQYGEEAGVLISGRIDSMNQVRREYRDLEAMLEHRSFFEQTAVQLTNQASLQVNTDMSKFVEDTMAELVRYAGSKETGAVRIRFGQLFEALHQGGQFSVVYVKYLCVELLKALYGNAMWDKVDEFQQRLELIYKTNRMMDLKSVMDRLIEDTEAKQAASGDENRKEIEEVIRIIRTEFDRELTVEGLAERVFLSPNYLSHLFSKRKGVGLVKYLTLFRLEKAKELLADKDRRIADVSKMVGYSNVPYFCSLFKTYFEKTPTRFREELGL
ncbi:response regulator [Paenibacillus sp. MBLB4367]|uniref:response regulator transcription factor n=1 Tax=Paenibacillus sp. MBLB4367 TaxID=3384767 RepID=UPI003908214D